MSEPWDQPCFEQRLNDDSLVFDEASWLTDAIDLDAQYPPAPEEPIQDQQDPAHQAEKQSPGEVSELQLPEEVKPSGKADHAVVLSDQTPPFLQSSRPSMVDRSSSALARSSGSTSPRCLPEKQRAFACKEPQCKARYARKGDLARHKREKHSDEEHLCPYRPCLWHRKGHGFKRIHRLASHLLNSRMTGWDHPRALTRLDARYIAVDFNNNLLTQNLLWGPNEMRDSSEEEAVLLDRYGERYSELAKYVDCLKGLHCPQAGCNVFLLSRSVDGLYELRLRSHLHDEHKLGWDETEACAREAIAAQKDTV